MLEIPMALASAIPEIYKLIIADKQQKLADQYAQTPRPQYQIPQAQGEATDLARNSFLNQQLPGQSTMENKLSGITANTASKAAEVGNPNTILTSLNAANANQNDAQNFLNTKASEYHDQNKNALLNELNRMAPYQQYGWDYNQKQPYDAAMHAASALRYGSIMNTNNGLTGLAGVGNQLLGSTINPYQTNSTAQKPVIQQTNNPNGQIMDNFQGVQSPYNYNQPNQLFG